MEAQVLEKIKGAFERFSRHHGVALKDVSIVARLDKGDVVYHKVISNKFFKNEDGSLEKLNFNKDILGVKFSVLPIEMLVSNKLKNTIEVSKNVYEVEGDNVLLRIVSFDEYAENLGMTIYHGSKLLKSMTATEFFEQD